MHWSEIVGHPREIEMLRRAVDHHRLPPAYLFTGPEGVGRRQVAGALVKSLFCAERSGSDFCDACSVCRRIDSNSFPEVVLLSHADGAIKIEKTREVQHLLAYRPSEGDRKAIIIDGAEDLTPAAANSLLKMLEEPPGGALFILIAGGTEGLLPTVISRCQRVAFAPLQVEEIAGVLARKLELDPEMARAIAASAQGSVSRALTISPETRRCFRELVEQVILQGKEGFFAEEVFSSNRLDMIAELELLRGFLRDCMVMKLKGSGSPPAAGLMNPDFEDILLRERERCWEDLLARLELVEDGILLLRANANARLVADRIVLGLG